MSCIYQVCLVHSFEGELCFLKHFCIQHYIVLNHDIGMQHWITHKHRKWEFWYPLYIRGVWHYMPYIYRRRTYTWNIHGIYRLYNSLGFQMMSCKLFKQSSCQRVPSSSSEMLIERKGKELIWPEVEQCRWSLWHWPWEVTRMLRT